MTSGRYRKASPEVIKAILDCFAERLSVTEILKRTGTSTPVLYKVIADFPLWTHYLKKDINDA